MSRWEWKSDLDGEEADGIECGSSEWRLDYVGAGRKCGLACSANPGQIITSVNRKAVSNCADFYEALVKASDRSRVLILISDGRSSRFAVVVLSRKKLV